MAAPSATPFSGPGRARVLSGRLRGASAPRPAYKWIHRPAQLRPAFPELHRPAEAQARWCLWFAAADRLSCVHSRSETAKRKVYSLCNRPLMGICILVLRSRLASSASCWNVSMVSGLSLGSTPNFRFELLDQMVGQSLTPVEASQHHIAVRRQDTETGRSVTDNGHVKGPAPRS